MKNKDVLFIGNIINFEQKHKERVEREAEQLADRESNEGDPIRTLRCTCGSASLSVYTDSEFTMAECAECRMPMRTQLFMFIQGEI
tara:strand:+ start:339 stop:596 length:258 start_codon:yes stop_codon:yes gene_type:complete